ncbi:MAG TPA: hypothetical protein PKY12_12805 [Catalimonadaceae bacterium]|nr:hypothetical protein [Catalimonadaceae bacterium]
MRKPKKLKQNAGRKILAISMHLVGIDAYLVFTNLTATPSVVKLKMVG